jgi:hypothetical protein
MTRTLESWRREHRKYFTRLGQFAEDMMRAFSGGGEGGG